MSKSKKNTTKISKSPRPPILSGRDALAVISGKDGKKKRPWREQAAVLNQEADRKLEETQATEGADAKSTSDFAAASTSPAERKMSALDAAAKILSEAEMPLNAKMIVDRMITQRLWTTQGRTPSATIYASMIREIAAKGELSRFKKTDRGLFVLRKN